MTENKIETAYDVTTVLKPAKEVFNFPKFTLASEALIAAKRIIQDERRWVTSELAVMQELDSRENGKLIVVDVVACGTKAKNAVAFCALGALQFVNGPAQRKAIGFLREAGKKILGKDEVRNNSIMSVNDELGHRDTMRMFTLAINAAKKAEAAQVPLLQGGKQNEKETV